ncbi:MAG: hypothetical protein Ct9H90mP7_3990 [Candidatus Neomarinimicrobiota bacterium]|nr:MAG: hypothetical protein Ct9H90mP7_3990 [Candidatus Neomarinimicrobiota bacterium]
MLNYILYLFLLFVLLISSDEGIFGYWLTSGSIVRLKIVKSSLWKDYYSFCEDGIDPNSILDKNKKINLLEKEH